MEFSLGVALIAVTPQKPDGALTAKETNELTYAVLSDPGNQIAGALGILTETGDDAVAVPGAQPRPVLAPIVARALPKISESER